jgi:phosphatidylglycerophosphatase A
VHRFVASWFGTGLILRRVRGSDSGSGTVGAFFAIPVAWALASIGIWAHLLGAAAVAVASVWSSSRFLDEEDSTKHGDPGWVVVDEAAGVLLATVGLGLPGAIVAWLVFRVADIFKSFFPGVAGAERLSGGIGITADDLVAGLYGLVAGWIVQTLLG